MIFEAMRGVVGSCIAFAGAVIGATFFVLSLNARKNGSTSDQQVVGLVCSSLLFAWGMIHIAMNVGTLRRYLQREQRITDGLCPNCGYNLTANESGICPECGEKA